MERHFPCGRRADIAPENITWLWRNWLPLNKLALLAGDSKAGKSTLSMTMAAIVSNGDKWPDGTVCKKSGHVLIWTSEDGIADTVVPRLIAAGANMRNVHIIQGPIGPQTGKPESFDPSKHIPDLKSTIIAEDRSIRLVIILMGRCVWSEFRLHDSCITNVSTVASIPA